MGRNKRETFEIYLGLFQFPRGSHSAEDGFLKHHAFNPSTEPSSHAVAICLLSQRAVGSMPPNVNMWTPTTFDVAPPSRC